MYLDSKVAYREYVQNACDQIDKAIDSGIVTPELAEVAIFIDQKKRYVSIEDNATGVREKISLHSWVTLQTPTKRLV